MTRRSDEERASTVAGRAAEDDFARVAHDLRTPLSAVLMWVRLLRAGSVPDPAVALAAIEKSAVEMSRSIDRLSRATSGGSCPAPPAEPRRRKKGSKGPGLPGDAKRETVGRSSRAIAAPRRARPRGGPARG